MATCCISTAPVEAHLSWRQQPHSLQLALLTQDNSPVFHHQPLHNLQFGDTLIKTLEVRLASLSREWHVTLFDGDVFERSRSVLEQAPVALVRGLVRPLAMDERGCRLLQSALEMSSICECRTLASEFRGHVWEALESPHANHVLQRLVELLPPRATRFILEELASGWDLSPVIQHRFGCRLLERILEHFTACPQARSDLEFFVCNGAFGDLTAHCHHAFGTHVMQHLLEHGSVEQQRLVRQALQRDIRRAAADEYAVGVVDRALTHLPCEDQRSLARDIAQEEGLLMKMATSWRGQPAVEQLLRVAQGAVLQDACQQLLSKHESLKRSKGGRSLLAIASRKVERAMCGVRTDEI